MYVCVSKGNQMWRVLKSNQIAVESMQLIWSVCLMDLQQMEQLVSHSVVVKLETHSPQNTCTVDSIQAIT